MGTSQSGGINYGGALFPVGLDEGLSYSGPYGVSMEDLYWNKGITVQNNYIMDEKLPWWRCSMFKRSWDFCLEAEYTYDSNKNRCQMEREDMLNCLYHGKESRFLTIWGRYHLSEEGERTYAKFMNKWEKTRYDEDHGDYLERAATIKKMYEERGLQGPKWQGNLD
eukprot:TRINITY_DN38757_c0_g1_i1.p1 TRINITY_DN38757_c0_g1~~TRINITY_DN38757_c0_g1_i1.p1  ORF type:complete len:166 (+),score=11.60 TRINITY_DN38757_c0_g1_i1:42-539(+)